MRRLLLACFALTFTFCTAAEAASPCRSAGGKFVKCATAKPAKCRDAKGKFTACTAGPAKAG